MKKKNNYKNYNRYEVKDKTSKFVKEKLPAYVLALLMVFWTIASVLGVVAFFNRDKKESAMNIVTANAQVAFPMGSNTEFEIQLPCLQGTIFNQQVVMDSAFVYFDSKATYFVPNGYRRAFYDNTLDRTQFLITNINGDSTDGRALQMSIGRANGISDGTLNVDVVSATDRFPTRDFPYDYYYVNQYSLYLDKADTYLKLYFAFDIFWSYNDETQDSETFTICLQLSTSLVTSQYVAVPYFNFRSNDTLLDYVLVDTDSSISNKYYQKLWYDYDKLFYEYQSLEVVVNDLNRQLGVLENKLREYEDVALDYPIIENDLNNMIERYNALKRDYDSLQNQYNELQNEYDTQLQLQYEEGKRAGYVNGYDVGYAEGALNANEYTFDGLLSAVFDVPVRTFKSLFEFEILGVNLANFFLSLLTLAIIIFIVRWIL